VDYKPIAPPYFVTRENYTTPLIEGTVDIVFSQESCGGINQSTDLLQILLEERIKHTETDGEHRV